MSCSGTHTGRCSHHDRRETARRERASAPLRSSCPRSPRPAARLPRRRATAPPSPSPRRCRRCKSLFAAAPPPRALRFARPPVFLRFFFDPRAWRRVPVSARSDRSSGVRRYVGAIRWGFAGLIRSPEADSGREMLRLW
ncbi:hypothetical protein PVAP13_9NG073731 [Panicum virgatum]|uniref:Uncharacterized protein n=1 Tax=Panicum virgatum TaxID=38727 RepID=A0A8T0MCX2_PANVG|nr:hypothetical protein PVAP13_9NG073731 [Panicum virgatum]